MAKSFCSACGSKAAEADRFCSTCGSLLADGLPIVPVVAGQLTAVGKPGEPEIDEELPVEMKGAAIGAGVAGALFPNSPAMKAIGEFVGRHVGKRIASGTPIIAVGVDPVAQALATQHGQQGRRARSKQRSLRRKKHASKS